MIAWVGYENVSSFERRMVFVAVRARLRRTESEVRRLYNEPLGHYAWARRTICPVELERVP